MKQTPSSALVIMTLLVVAGCGIDSEESPHQVDLAQDSSLFTDVELETGGAERVVRSIYLLRDNQLVHMTREFNRESFDLGELFDAVALGPTPAEARSGFWSAIPPSTSVLGIEVESRVVVVDLSANFASVGGQDEILAIAQIVLTFADQRGSEAVTFRIDGVETNVPGPDGALIAGPVTFDDFASLLGS